VCKWQEVRDQLPDFDEFVGKQVHWRKHKGIAAEDVGLSYDGKRAVADVIEQLVPGAADFRRLRDSGRCLLCERLTHLCDIWDIAGRHVVQEDDRVVQTVTDSVLVMLHRGSLAYAELPPILPHFSTSYGASHVNVLQRVDAFESLLVLYQEQAEQEATVMEEALRYSGGRLLARAVELLPKGILPYRRVNELVCVSSCMSYAATEAWLSGGITYTVTDAHKVTELYTSLSGEIAAAHVRNVLQGLSRDGHVNVVTSEFLGLVLKRFARCCVAAAANDDLAVKTFSA
jgi:hypothetical protein